MGTFYSRNQFAGYLAVALPIGMAWLWQDAPEDFVIATGVQHSVREFVEAAAKRLGIGIRWQGAGVEEVGVVDGVSGESGPAAGSVIVRVDPRYFRPAKVDSLLGDAGKARERLGWTPKVTFEELVQEMVDSDLELARRDDLCLEQGFPVFNRHE